MDAFSQLLRNVGPARLAGMVGIAGTILVFFFFLSTRISTTDMTLLYGDLEMNDSAQIVTQLEAAGVPFELRGEGRQILVPSDQVLRLRMTMAQEGLPSGGTIGYEIFDRSTSFGVTNFHQQINHLRALEGELSRTIRSLDQIAGARVHLVLPQRELFTRKEREPSASIVLKMRGGAQLGASQVQAIQNLVAAAVPKLMPGRISVVDDHGTLLASGVDDGGAGSRNSTSLYELRQAQESRLRHAIETLLGQSVGPGRVRAEVTVDIDLNRVTTTAETYDPDGQVVRSTQTVEESESSSELDQDLPVGVAGNLPDADMTATGTAGSQSSNNRTEETVNYEISKTVKTEIHESGMIKRISAAVLVDGIYAEGEKGESSYSPRSEEDLARLASLVRSAIGYDESRGDKVDVINMQFVQPEPVTVEEDTAAFLGFAKADFFKMAELFVLGIVAVLVLLLVVRPLVGHFLTAAPLGSGASRDGAGMARLPDGETAAIAGPDDPTKSALDEFPEESGDIESMIDMDRVEGRVRASSIKKIGEIVEKHPEDAIAILRQWMYQDG